MDVADLVRPSATKRDVSDVKPRIEVDVGREDQSVFFSPLVAGSESER